VAETQRGASTITMQLARNISFYAAKEALRKLKKCCFAMQIERRTDKIRFSSCILNIVSFGKRAYGAPARHTPTTARPLTQLTLRMGHVGGIPQRPSASDPVNAPKHD